MDSDCRRSCSSNCAMRTARVDFGGGGKLAGLGTQRAGTFLFEWQQDNERGARPAGGRGPQQFSTLCLAEKLWSASSKEARQPRTVVLKLKTKEFKILTRSYTPDHPPASCDELTKIALKLRDRVDLSPQQRYRLVVLKLKTKEFKILTRSYTPDQSACFL
jgi:hypothetical protein